MQVSSSPILGSKVKGWVFHTRARKGLFLSFLRTEKSGALGTFGVLLVEELVQAVKVFGRAAVKVVPPIADEILLVEHGSVGAEEGVVVAIGLTHVEDLDQLSF